MRSGNKFTTLFMITALLLMVVPFISTFNEFLTSIFLKWRLYRVLEEIVVPYEAKILAGIFNALNIGARANLQGVWIKGTFLEIQWNCLGWQSGVLLLATFLTGFQGNFTRTSRFETIFIGIMGTYLINIVRMMIVGLFAVLFGSRSALIFHDWFSLIFVIIWFFLYWYFCYSYVLEEVSSESKVDTSKIASNANVNE